MVMAMARLLATLLAFALIAAIAPVAADLNDDVDVLWGSPQLLREGDGSPVMPLSLDQWAGTAFRSKIAYLFGRFDVDIKLVAGDSAGTVTTLYLLSDGEWDIHDEIDLEFLGNVSGEPYTLHTNIFANGKGRREMQYRLWFDPTTDFHTYTIIWNPREIIIMVDETPIRRFRNHWKEGVPFPVYQPMRVYGCIWNADDWATQGGRVKTDWARAPFVAYFRNFTATACVPYGGGSWICSEGSPRGSAWFEEELDEVKEKELKQVEEKDRIYSYCSDNKRFSDGLPKECGLS